MYSVGLELEGNKNVRNEEECRGEPSGRAPTPVTPKILIMALKKLKKKAFKGLFFTPAQVAREIQKTFSQVEQDLQMLFLEVSDKLACAAAAGLVGSKPDVGYFALDFRQSGVRADSRSELMFWLFYKRLLDRKKSEEEKKLTDDRRAAAFRGEKKDGGRLN